MDARRVGDVGFEKLVSLAELLGDAREVRGISSVGERIDIRDHLGAEMLEDITDEIAADEAAAAGDEETHEAR